DLADTLVLAGRSDESAKSLLEVQELSGDLKNPTIESAVWNTQGDARFYGGDPKSARSAYEQSLRVAGQAKDRDKTLQAKIKLARVAVAEGKSQAAVNDLRASIQQADSFNLKYFSLSATVDMADAMITLKDYARARQELERALSRSEKLGSRLETARIHYLLGNAIRLGGSPRDAASQYGQALRLLDEMKKEAGAEHLLDRSDLKALYADANHWFSAT